MHDQPTEILGRHVHAMRVPLSRDNPRPLPEDELHGVDLWVTRLDCESRLCFVTESLEDVRELGPYDADAFEVAFPKRGH